MLFVYVICFSQLSKMIESQTENNFNKENTVSENSMGDVKVLELY